MNIVVLTPVRVLGDGLVACLHGRAGINVIAVTEELVALRELLGVHKLDLILVDVTQGIERYDVRSLANERPDVAFVALGIAELRREVVRCGRAGFSGYVARNATVESLVAALSDILAGRQVCPSNIAGALLRALSDDGGTLQDPTVQWPQTLTRRECEVLQLLGNGQSNKEIARELFLSVATVKRHVHNILDKFQLPRRTQIMHHIRNVPRALPLCVVSKADVDDG